MHFNDKTFGNEFKVPIRSHTLVHLPLSPNTWLTKDLTLDINWQPCGRFYVLIRTSENIFKVSFQRDTLSEHDLDASTPKSTTNSRVLCNRHCVGERNIQIYEWDRFYKILSDAWQFSSGSRHRCKTHVLVVEEPCSKCSGWIQCTLQTYALWAIDMVDFYRSFDDVGWLPRPWHMLVVTIRQEEPSNHILL